MDWLIDLLKNGGSVDPKAAAISVGLTLVLSLAIAWLHRRTFRGAAYTQDYAHTLVIISVVTTVLISVVSGSLAIGLGMFAAFSVVRFPRNLGQSSDLAFLFFAIAVGMVSGTGRYPMAVLMTLGIGVAIWLLYRSDAFSPLKSSHVLTVNFGSDEDFEAVLAPVFAEHTLDSRLLRLTPSPDNSRTVLSFGLELKPGTSTPRLVEALHHACGNQRIILEPTNRKFDVER